MTYEYTEITIPNEVIAKTLTEYGKGSWSVSVMLWRTMDHTCFLLQREYREQPAVPSKTRMP
jgi:hypothetical protein